MIYDNDLWQLDSPLYMYTLTIYIQIVLPISVIRTGQDSIIAQYV